MRSVSYALLILAILSGQVVLAAHLKSSCFLSVSGTQPMTGVNIDERYPIASVSKLMTAYWAVSAMGSDARFHTWVHLRLLDNGAYDVHLQGSRDPYFGRNSLQFLVAELNALGVKKIRELSFDENFKFLVDTNGSVASTHLDNPDPLFPQVRSHLRLAFTKLEAGYDKLRSKAKNLAGVRLPEKLTMSVERIEPQLRLDFDPRDFDSSYLYRSAPVLGILKEMNRNSNNYSANNIFESLGGPEAFHSFIQRRLRLGLDAIRFVNGSGDRKDFADGSSAYNEANCRAVIMVVKALHHELQIRGFGLEDVMAVTGRNAPGERSTAESYNNDETSGALIAKTGTINPAITLAGMVSTEEDQIYFNYTIQTSGSVADAQTARRLIKTAVTKLIKENGGREPLSLKVRSFLSFDQESRLTSMPGMP